MIDDWEDVGYEKPKILGPGQHEVNLQRGKYVVRAVLAEVHFDIDGTGDIGTNPDGYREGWHVPAGEIDKFKLVDTTDVRFYVAPGGGAYVMQRGVVEPD